MYDGREKDWIWEEAGISLYFPESSCNKQIKISVAVVDIEDVVLPRPFRLMPTASAIYQITSSDPLPEPVTVRIQHCADLKRKDSLMHIVAHDGSPYKFSELSDGNFPLDLSYGEISLNSFSFLTILYNIWDWHMLFSLHVFYRTNNTVTFVLTKNLNAHITAVKDEFSDAIKDETDTKIISCNFTTTAISLDIPKPEGNKWSIEPAFTPAEINMMAIHHYEPGQDIPQIKLHLKWEGQNQPTEQNIDIKIKVHGGKEESYRLRCKPRSGVSTFSPTTTTPLLPLHNLPLVSDFFIIHMNTVFIQDVSMATKDSARERYDWNCYHR